MFLHGAHTTGGFYEPSLERTHRVADDKCSATRCDVFCAETGNMESKILIDPNADITGIRPEDVIDGVNYRITTDIDADVLSKDKRNVKSGKGTFEQYTMSLQDKDGKPTRIRFLFERHLAPLAKVYGPDPEAWRGKLVHIRGIRVKRQGGEFWDVELSAV